MNVMQKKDLNNIKNGAINTITLILVVWLMQHVSGYRYHHLQTEEQQMCLKFDEKEETKFYRRLNDGLSVI